MNREQIEQEAQSLAPSLFPILETANEVSGEVNFLVVPRFASHCEAYIHTLVSAREANDRGPSTEVAEILNQLYSHAETSLNEGKLVIVIVCADTGAGAVLSACKTWRSGFASSRTSQSARRRARKG